MSWKNKTGYNENVYYKVLVWEDMYDFRILGLSKNKEVFSFINQFTCLASSPVSFTVCFTNALELANLGKTLNWELAYECLDYSESSYVMLNRNTSMFRGSK